MMLAEQSHTDAETGGERFPRHIAIIMDGNSRWARKHGEPVREGHRRGSQALKDLLENCRETGLRYLTVYAFSSENWSRPQDEISDLMELLRFYLRHEVQTLHDNGVRIRFIGDRSMLGGDIRDELQRTEQLTAANSALTLVIALSYGSRQELRRAMQTIAREAAAGLLMPDEIDEATVLAHLDTAAIPDPDLLIRTGGEQRLSNFLLWQSAYSELYFTDVLWPDFTIEHLREAIAEYGLRERRFGGRHEG